MHSILRDGVTVHGHRNKTGLQRSRELEGCRQLLKLMYGVVRRNNLPGGHDASRAMVVSL